MFGLISRTSPGANAFFQGFSGSKKSSSVGPSKVSVACGGSTVAAKQAIPLGAHCSPKKQSPPGEKPPRLGSGGVVSAKIHRKTF